MNIKTGDFILITDYHDDNYLRIGKVVETDYYPDGDKKTFRVTFDKPTEHGTFKVSTYKAMDLEDYKCKVLQFADR